MTLSASADVDKISHLERLGTSEESDVCVTKRMVRFYVCFILFRHDVEAANFLQQATQIFNHNFLRSIDSQLFQRKVLTNGNFGVVRATS